MEAALGCTFNGRCDRQTDFLFIGIIFIVLVIVIRGAARHFWKATWTNCSAY
jgi:hypothetical protein